jgi:hypothetical protein
MSNTEQDTRSDMQQFDRVVATFEPIRRDDLKAGAAEWIGRTLTWQASWIVEEGDYEGQWAMAPMPPLGAPATDWPPFTWIPLCDLRIEAPKQ